MSMLDGLGRQRTLGVLLAIAVAINMLLIGLIAGRISAGWMRPPSAAFGFDHGTPFFTAHYHDEMFRAVRAAMPDMRAQHHAMKKLHRQLAEELAKPQPDRALLEQHFGAIRAQMQATQQALHSAFLDTALKMPVAERREMLDNLRRHRRGMRMNVRPPGMVHPEAEFDVLLPSPAIALPPTDVAPQQTSQPPPAPDS